LSPSKSSKLLLCINFIIDFSDDNEGHEGILNSYREEGDGRTPLLFVDVNLGVDSAARIIVYEGETAKELA